MCASGMGFNHSNTCITACFFYGCSTHTIEPDVEVLGHVFKLLWVQFKIQEFSDHLHTVWANTLANACILSKHNVVLGQ